MLYLFSQIKLLDGHALQMGPGVYHVNGVSSAMISPAGENKMEKLDNIVIYSSICVRHRNDARTVNKAKPPEGGL